MSKKKILVASAVLLTLLGLYALAGFVGVPRLVKAQLAELFARDYGREVQLGEVRFNPFTFEFEASGFSVPDADGEPMLGFGRLYLDFETASLWHRAWTFRQIALEQPYLRVLQRADGQLNLIDLAPPPDGAPPGEEPASVPAVRIGQFALTGGWIHVEDRARPEPFTATLAPVSFELTDFRNTGDGNRFGFSAGSDRVGRLTIDGQFAVAPLSSRGQVSLAGLQASALSEYLGELLPLTLASGVIDLGLAYDFSLSGEPFTFKVEMPSLTIRELSTVAAGHEQPWTVQSVDVRDTRLDLAARSVVVSSVEIAGVEAPAWLDASGFNAPGVLPRSGAPPAARDDDIGAASGPGSPDPVDAADAEWTVSIPSISLADARLPFEDRTLSRPATLELAARSVKIGGFALPSDGPLQVEALLAAGTGGELSARGTLQLEPLAAAVDLELQGLDLTPLQPYLDGATDLLLDAGQLGSRGRVELVASDPLDLRFAGALQVDGLRSRDRPLQQDFVNWKSLEVKGIRYASRPQSLGIDSIVLRQPYLRLVLADSGVTNIEAVLDPQAAAAKAAAIAAERAAAKDDKGGRAEQPAAGTAAAAATEAAGGPAAEPALPVAIGRTQIVDGNIDFADYTIEPDFRIAMERLNGSITGSSSDPKARSRVEIDGQVDRYAPVRIAGELNLLAPLAYIDLEANFRNIELTSFNPYSTKFIGYQVAKGKLSIDTSYKVEDNRLAANHDIKLDQLEFGEKIDSPDAIGLPIKLAVALLKDSKGVIDLSLPISGSLDDPQFVLGPIIWKAVIGLLTKAVTAPFALLGSLFGGGADLSYVDFAAGSPQLDAAALEKIAALRKALVERPGLRLDIPWTALPATDGAALEQAAWDAALRGAGGPGQAADEGWRTDREQYLKRLKALYLAQNGQKPDLPKPPKPAAGEPGPDPVEFQIGLLEPGLRAGVAPQPAQLEALAEGRAIALRDALLGEPGIEAERVFVSRGQAQATAGDGGTVRMTLSLE